MKIASFFFGPTITLVLAVLLCLTVTTTHAQTCPTEVSPPANSLAQTLLTALDQLTLHAQGFTVLTETEIQGFAKDVDDNKALLETSRDAMEVALDLVDIYEANQLPLFMNPRTINGFLRAANDGKELERAMLVVQQAILDVIYHGTLTYFVEEDHPNPSVVGPCMTLLEGRKWLTSTYFPGAVAPPTDKTIEYQVQMKASVNSCWGGAQKVAYCKKPSIRATGLYLAPGEIATITVPESMVGTGYKIQVGGNNIDNINKNYHLRMDRITATFDIIDATTYVGNPLGGGIYIRVPYLGTAGVVEVSISGGVVQAPIFEKTSLRTTTPAEWSTLRTAPGPWADFVTDKFLLQVPRIWMYGYDHSEIDALLTTYDLSMDGVAELCGYLPDERNDYVAYVAPDLHIRHDAFGIGYPLVNDVVEADLNGVKPYGPVGRSSHWFFTEPLDDEIFYHELGHMQALTMYEAENEAIVNLLLAYVQNVKFDVPLDTAFILSFPRSGIFTVDAAAISWMVTNNYRAGNEMDGSGGITDEYKYQHRGYAKYADIARLFGWSVVTYMHRQELLDHNSGTHSHYCPGLADSDYRTLKFSLKAGVDLTPLIHFWGIHPVDSQLLQQCMEDRSLTSSNVIKEQLLRYAGIVPVTQQDFIVHFEEVWSGKKDCDCCESDLYGCGWYNAQYPLWDESASTAAISATMDIINLYWPPCEDTKPTNWCTKRLTNCASLSQCDLTCGKCPYTLAPIAPPTPSQTPPPVLPPTPPQTSPPVLPPTPPQTPPPVLPPTPHQTPPPAPAPQCVGHNARCDSDNECCSGNCKNNGKCQGNRLLRHLQGPEAGGPPGLNRADVQAKLDNARGKWKSKDINNYDLELWRDFFGPEQLMGPFIIKIRNNKLISAKYKFTGNIVEEAVLSETPGTMDELYDLILFESNQNIDNMDVIYADDDGHPTQVFVSRAESDAEEGAQVYFIRNFAKQ